MTRPDPVLTQAAAFARLAERHPRTTFLGIQVGVWGLFYVIQYLALLPVLTSGERIPFLLLEFMMFVTGPLITALMHLAYSRLPGLPGGLAARLVIVIAIIWLGTRLWIVVDGMLLGPMVALTGVSFDWDRVGRLMGGGYWLTLLAWTGGYYAVRFWRELGRRERAVLDAQLRTREAQLRALAYQLNPHFLFNTLNSVRALVLEEPERAREMITRLGGFLRYTLTLPERGENTLEAELEALSSYLAIEQARFEERLTVMWEVDPPALRRVVPSLILQPLVENAIQHGGDDHGGGLELRIEVRMLGSQVRIAVSNTGQLTDPAAPAGVGLQNVRARLMHAFPGRHHFDLREAGGWVTAELYLGGDTPAPPP